ncbi:MAG: 5-oxoprolinase subunit PxpB [Dehalococcoidales bacterium]|nr:5-oxoprolinase subunit PxpB [Dehalococcoidales bacterium]
MSTLYDEPRLLPAGESALVVEFADAITPEANERVMALARALAARPLAGLGEAVPTYRSLLVHFDPLLLGEERLRRHLAFLLGDLAAGPADVGTGREGRLHEIPTVYGGEMGPDLAGVAAITGLDEDEVVRLHGEETYTVYMIGFLPGFPYLGTLPEALATPRLESPRLAVPAGSVAITGRQTGIYPMESPGGWRIIGRTPWRLFDVRRDPPSFLAPGDRVRFVPVAAADFERLGREQAWP